MELLAEIAHGTARDLLGRVPPIPVATALADGSIVHVTAVDGAPAALELLAEAGSAKAAIHRIAARFKLDPLHPPAVEAEAQACVAAPGIDDPALVDLEHLAFCTIDNDDSRDLDQALCIAKDEADPDGHVVWYALADASYYVRPGTALFREALARGASYYLPGVVVPMLPRSLSEGIVSLNADVRRRALVFRAELDGAGQVRATSFVRGRIRSRAKLSYHGVQRHYGDGSLAGHDFSETLDELRVVGQRRIKLAEARHVVEYVRHEIEIGYADQAGLRFVAFEEGRTDTDRYNEQISLLVNSEGAELLARHLGDPSLQAIFRVHPEPAEVDIAALERHIGALVALHQLDASWRWKAADEPLAAYVARLPTTGPHAAIAQAIERQALLVNQRSSFAAEPGLHYGVGVPLYARFSSPMREMVGIFTHKEALEALAGVPGDPADLALRDAVIQKANAAKVLQKELTKAANQLVIDALLRPGMELAGIVLGLGPDKLYVQLDDPPLEVKVYAVDLGKDFALDKGGVSASVGGRRFALGDRVQLSVLGHDDIRDRWRLAPRAPAP
ncbi:MAG: RNB domain-containing ribonuclease [Myxococcota bacterium]